VYFLTTRPTWFLILLLLLFTALAMTAPVLIRRWIPLERLRSNNEVAGFKFAVIGVLYAVLLAFAVVIAWERFFDAEKALASEGGAAATIYRLSAGLGQPTAGGVRDRLEAYLNSVLRDDWPAMALGHSSRKTNEALNALYREVVQYRPADLQQEDLQNDLFRELDKLTEARRERIVMSSGTVPGMIWFVLLFGGILTIAFTFFFGAQNVMIQSQMTGILAALIFSAILVIISIDRPFTGAVEVSQESIRLVLEDFQTPP
jgi:hypothetical protein